MEGDFNDISRLSDKRGGRGRPDWIVRGFKDTLLHYTLVGLGFSGYGFILRKTVREGYFMEERLDRFLVTQQCKELSPNA